MDEALTFAPMLVFAPTLKASLEPTELLYWTVPFDTVSVPTLSVGAIMPADNAGTEAVVVPVSLAKAVGAAPKDRTPPAAKARSLNWFFIVGRPWNGEGDGHTNTPLHSQR